MYAPMIAADANSNPVSGPTGVSSPVLAAVLDVVVFFEVLSLSEVSSLSLSFSTSLISP